MIRALGWFHFIEIGFQTALNVGLDSGRLKG